MSLKTLLAGAAFTIAAGTTLAILTGPVLADGYITQATSDLKDLGGNTIGLATLKQSPHGLLIHIKVEGQEPGKKGVHIHAKAHCDAGTGFKSSHGHHGEAKGAHGLMNPAGPGTGDLGNIFVGTDGIGEMEVFKAGASLDGGDLPLLDEDGSAIVIHANADDHVSQHIGGAGARVVCGTIFDGPVTH